MRLLFVSMSALLVTACGAPSALDAQVRAEMASLPRLQPHYSVPSLPPAMRGLRVLVIARVVGGRTEEQTSEQVRQGCAEAGRELLTQIGWIPVASASEPHDLVWRGSCSGHVAIAATDDGDGMVARPRTEPTVIETPDGQVVETLAPGPEKMRCPQGIEHVDVQTCGAPFRELVESGVVSQIAGSARIAEVASRRGGGS
jgi:hypothetical protein